jgi:hypothetical protein
VFHGSREKWEIRLDRVLIKNILFFLNRTEKLNLLVIKFDVSRAFSMVENRRAAARLPFLPQVLEFFCSWLLWFSKINAH